MFYTPPHPTQHTQFNMIPMLMKINSPCSFAQRPIKTLNAMWPLYQQCNAMMYAKNAKFYDELFFLIRYKLYVCWLLYSFTYKRLTMKWTWWRPKGFNNFSTFFSWHVIFRIFMLNHWYQNFSLFKKNMSYSFFNFENSKKGVSWKATRSLNLEVPMAKSMLVFIMVT